MKRAYWTPDEVEELTRLYPHYRAEDIAFLLGREARSVYNKAMSLALKKAPEFLASVVAGRWDGIRGGATRFQKGLVPWNKGMKGVVGVQAACRATQFKPGNLPHTTEPIGALRVTKDGTLQRKISNDHGSNSKRWRGVHELVWVEANGPVPPKHIVVFKPGMRTKVLDEITVDRVECISLTENMKRNTRHNLPPELNEVIQLRAVLTRQINKRSKQNGTESNDPRSA
ncbi:MAG: hypothetical protein ACXVG9_12715 [Terriglobales bacterium]